MTLLAVVVPTPHTPLPTAHTRTLFLRTMFASQPHPMMWLLLCCCVLLCSSVFSAMCVCLSTVCACVLSSTPLARARSLSDLIHSSALCALSPRTTSKRGEHWNWPLPYRSCTAARAVAGHRRLWKSSLGKPPILSSGGTHYLAPTLLCTQPSRMASRSPRMLPLVSYSLWTRCVHAWVCVCVYVCMCKCVSVCIVHPVLAAPPQRPPQRLLHTS
jgi:hypothetical protein